ncbi:MAG: GNAT family N-acetyltransferase [Anaerolineales bacterium]|nr:GNAT family N-acetyltransferase [Anaerolineales bacterium]MCB9127347.1 GNAT family N-acetyltransferase [Ardenticatenales bacterium]
MSETRTPTIRPLAADDHEALLALARRLAAWFRPLDQMMLAIDLAQHKGWVATEQGTIVAFLLYFLEDAEQAELSWLAVDPDAQGRGLGSQLLTQLEASLRSWGVTTLRLNTIPADHEAIFDATNAFYRQRGFDVEARHDDYYGHGRPALRLVKRLAVERVP